MFKFRSLLYDYIAVGIIVIIVLLLYITNFSGNYWISGWDNLHPEFNYQINLNRAIFSSWQEYQGLGLPAGHGHATEFSREIILLFLNIFFPTFFIRKMYILSMLFIGGLGMYFFIRNILLKKLNYEPKVILGSIAAMFYILNPATIQIFYVPYEAFMAYFGLFPWMIYSIYLFMNTPSKKNFLIFLLIQFVGTWQFYIPTLFIVYSFIAFFVLLGITIKKQFRKYWKLFALSLFGILIVNLYWLLPFINYTLTNINSQQDAYLNFLYTDDTFIKNAKFGALQDATLLKGFLFDYVNFSSQTGFDYLIGKWRFFTSTWYFLTIGYSIFTIAIIGIFRTVKERKYIYLAFLFILFFSFIANQTPPFSYINNLLHSVPVLEQVFRNPFTKFANAVLFFLTIFFVYGLASILYKINMNSSLGSKTKLSISRMLLSGCILLLIVYSLPIWKSGLIYPSLKVKIPKEYFQVFDFFKHQKNGRIANLPQYTPNGWNYYDWGYQGSGFIWYGIKQPILDRAFDVWNRDNENYYWEISEAIYSQNLSLFENLLEKYQINWLLIDEHITSPSSYKSLYGDKMETLLKESNNVLLVHEFGKIKIYEVKLNRSYENFISFAYKLPNILPVYTWNNNDQGFTDYGQYVSTNDVLSNDLNVFYPFRSLFTGRKQEEKEFDIQEDSKYFVLKSIIPKQLYNSDLIVPEIDPEEISEIDSNNFSEVTRKEPILSINNTVVDTEDYLSSNTYKIQLNNENDEAYLEVKIPNINGYYSNTSMTSSKLSQITPYNCNQFNKGDLSIDRLQNDASLFRLTSINSNNCLDFSLPNLTQRIAYLLSVPAKNISGKGLYISVKNQQSQRDDLATYLPNINDFTTSYFVIPPKENYGLGYVVHIDNISLDKTATINELGEIKINPIPYDFLSSIKFIKKVSSSMTDENTEQHNFKVIHDNPSQYKISIDPSPKSRYILLSQSFNNGWKAYQIGNDNLIDNLLPFLRNQELKNHLLVNNWANGWKIDGTLCSDNSKCTIAIIFWPQYLEYLGFILVIVAVTSTIFLFRKKT